MRHQGHPHSEEKAESKKADTEPMAPTGSHLLSPRRPDGKRSTPSLLRPSQKQRLNLLLSKKRSESLWQDTAEWLLLQRYVRTFLVVLRQFCLLNFFISKVFNKEMSDGLRLIFLLASALLHK
mmetsp:Transcript_1571/g.3774  ORF Transcript_1571/g.3774 Transcript_1571/m.3774 type:complete len:123 (-) Transcript_1571:1334-1702(-)